MSSHLSTEELVSHALLHAQTPLEQQLARALATMVDERDCEFCEEFEAKERIAAAKGADGLREAQVFAPHWPKGLKLDETYVVPCDDKGRTGESWLKVFIARDSDAHVIMQDWESFPEGMPSPLPSLRCRTHAGGGRNGRTHQALLWLARAIQLDREEAGR